MSKKPNQALKIQIPLFLVLKIISKLCFTLIILIRKHSNFFHTHTLECIDLWEKTVSLSLGAADKKSGLAHNVSSLVCSGQWAISGV